MQWEASKGLSPTLEFYDGDYKEGYAAHHSAFYVNAFCHSCTF